MKKFLNSAFTMAEAILVMTILGIIATIMISTLKPAEFKEKGMQVMAKKVLSEIDVATTQILMNNTADGTFDTIYEAGTSNIFQSRTQNASSKLANIYKSYLTTLRTQSKLPVVITAHGPSFILKDGAMVMIAFGPESCLSIFPGEINAIRVDCIGYVFFDINDNESPNVEGKDQFRLPLGVHGIMYAE